MMNTNSRTRKIAAALLGALSWIPQPVLAGSGTIAVKDANNVTRNFDIITDNSGNYVWLNGLCDYAAAANCAGVDAGHSLQIAGEGVAGTPAGGVVSIQGVSGGTNLSVSQATAANLLVTAAQSSAALLNVTAMQATAANLLVTAVQATAANLLVTAAQSTTANLNETEANSGAILSAIQSPVPAGTNTIGFVSNDPCAQLTKNNVPIATGSGTVQLVAGVASEKIYICSMAVTGGSAWFGSLIEGTGTLCVTANELAVVGSTTAASGMPFPATGGMTYGNGYGTIARTANASSGLCLLQSGTVALGGNLTYIQQ